MASFWTRLFSKSLCEKIGLRISDLLRVNTTKIIHDNSLSQNITVKGNALIINSAQEMPPQAGKAVSKLLQKLEQESGSVLLEETRNSVNELQELEGKGITQQMEEYFKPLVPPGDSRILRACFLLRRRLENKQGVDALKSDITRTYGPRGRNIANLCTERYFERWFKPLYEILLKRDPSTAIDQFREIYIGIVEELPWTVFVHRRLKEQEIVESIVTRLLTYRLGFVLVHGLGTENTRKINTICTMIAKEYPEIKISEISSQENIERMSVRFEM